MASTVNVIHACKFNTTDLSGITRSSLVKGQRASRIGGAGSLFETTGWIPEIMPRGELESIKLKEWLALLGMTGKKIDPEAGTPDQLDLWLADYSEGAQIDTTGIKASVLSGVMLPRTLSMPWGDHASLSVEVLMAAADGAAPYTLQAGQDLSAVTVDVSEAYHLTGVSLGGTALDYVQSCSIDFGIASSQMGSDGQPYPTRVSVARQSPSISITTQDASQIVTNAPAGSSRVVVITLSKIDTLTGQVISGSDITITTALGLTTDEGWSQSHASEVGVTLTHEVLYNGVAAPFVFTGLS